MRSFVYSFQSEWLKKRRTASSWLVIAGGFFIPVILLISRFVDFETLPVVNGGPHLWEFLYGRSWQFMGLFLLPMGVILATSLVTQLEFRNNSWKQLHATPQTLTTIFFAKLAVILVMMLQFFVLFNIGIYLCGVIPALFNGVPYPKEAYPWVAFLRGNGRFFVDCLPIIALQYLISLQFRNFLVPIGAGLGLYVASMIAIFWKYGYVVPYCYGALNFLRNNSKVDPNVNFQTWAVGYFVVLTVVGYVLYMTKKEKG
ncbi:MAG TPA: ABC transporter permease [Puia sp.]|jgi:hypothetical protein